MVYSHSHILWLFRSWASPRRTHLSQSDKHKPSKQKNWTTVLHFFTREGYKWTPGGSLLPQEDRDRNGKFTKQFAKMEKNVHSSRLPIRIKFCPHLIAFHKYRLREQCTRWSDNISSRLRGNILNLDWLVTHQNETLHDVATRANRRIRRFRFQYTSRQRNSRHRCGRNTT